MFRKKIEKIQKKWEKSAKDQSQVSGKNRNIEKFENKIEKNQANDQSQVSGKKNKNLKTKKNGKNGPTIKAKFQEK